MRRLALSGDPAAVVDALRSFAPPADEVRAAVSDILADVRARGDVAVRTQSLRLDHVDLPAATACPRRSWLTL